MLSWFRKRGAQPTAHCTVRFADGREPLTVARDSFLLAAALEAGLPWPHNCKVGTCGSCKARVLDGRVKPAMDFALSPLTADELRSGHVLACQSRVREDLLVDVSLPHAAPAIARRCAEVLAAPRAAEDVMHLQLRLDEPLDYLAGQYVNLRLDGMDAVRSYSICEPPAAGGRKELSFLIRRLPGGQFSERLFGSASPGTRIHLHGPFGAAAAVTPASSMLGVAGGTGLAPMLSLMQDRLSRAEGSRFTLLLGLRSQADDFASPLLFPLQQRFPGRIDIEIWLSNEDARSSWPGRRGMVVDGIDAELLSRSEATAAFLCGNGPMVHAGRQRLTQVGMPASAIHADTFAPSGSQSAALVTRQEVQ